MTLPRLPPIIEEKAKAYHRSMEERGICPMCNVVNLELGGPRQILKTDLFLAFCPWAPRHAFEFWIYPRKHQTSLLKATQKEIRELALIIRTTLGGLYLTLNDPPFNLVFNISSEKKTSKQIHWHIEVYPQLNVWAGLERGNNVFINPIPPEQASIDLGAHSRRELAELIGIY
jgi:UDPglucose--hexose-1-phosphate uridylyltransferase